MALLRLLFGLQTTDSTALRTYLTVYNKIYWPPLLYDDQRRLHDDQRRLHDDQGHRVAVAEEQPPVCRLLFCSATRCPAWRSTAVHRPTDRPAVHRWTTDRQTFRTLFYLGPPTVHLPYTVVPLDHRRLFYLPYTVVPLVHRRLFYPPYTVVHQRLYTSVHCCTLGVPTALHLLYTVWCTDSHAPAVQTRTGTLVMPSLAQTQRTDQPAVHRCPPTAHPSYTVGLIIELPDIDAKRPGLLPDRD